MKYFKQTSIAIVIIIFALWMFSGYCFLVCPFHWLTGLQCPLCGLQRCINALLHLHPIEAFGYNPWLIILGPYSLVVFIASISRRLASIPFVKWCYRDRTIFIMVIITILWGIIRNLGI